MKDRIGERVKQIIEVYVWSSLALTLAACAVGKAVKVYRHITKEVTS